MPKGWAQGPWEGALQPYLNWAQAPWEGAQGPFLMGPEAQLLVDLTLEIYLLQGLPALDYKN